MEKYYTLSDLEKNFDEILKQEEPYIKLNDQLNKIHDESYKNGNKNY